MQIEILGPLQVLDGTGRPCPVTGRSITAVLAQLVLASGRVVPLGELVDSIWGERLPESPTTAVQVAVSRLRRALGERERVCRSHGGYSLEASTDEVDLWTAEALLEEGRRLLAAGQPATAAAVLGQARSLWRGMPLVEFVALPFYAGSARRLEELYLSVAEAHHEALLGAGAAHEVLDGCRELIAANPWRERLRAQQILALDLAGRHVEAIRAYESYRHQLADELGVVPGRELQQVVEAVIRGRESANPNTAPRSGSDEPPRLVGRDRELQALMDAWAEVARGRTGVVALVGEPGIGKSRLATQMAHSLAVQRGAALLGRCRAPQAGAYAPLSDWVRSWCEVHGPEAARRLLSGATAALAWLIPEEADRLGVHPVAPIQGSSDHYWLADSLSAWISQQASATPLLLVADDIHLADPEALALLGEVIDKTAGTPLLILTTSQGSPGSFPLMWSSEEVFYVEVAVRGLDSEAACGLVADCLSTEAGPEARQLADHLVRQTGGNPLFIVEVLRDLAQRRPLLDEHGRLASVPALGDLSIPDSLRDLIVSRVRRMDAGSLLSVAALVGPEFDADVLTAALGWTRIEVLEALDQATQLGLVSAVRASSYRFAHQLVAAVIAEQGTDASRAAHHLRIAAALANQPGSRWAEVAHHYGAAGAGPEAAAAAHRAALEALAVGAVQEALMWVERGLASGPGRDGTECDLLTDRAEIERRIGHPGAGRTRAAATAAATRLGDGARLARALLSTSWMWPSPADIDHAQVRSLERALHMNDDDDLRARLLAALAAELAFDPDWERRRALADEAVASARRSGRPSTLVAVLNRRFNALWAPHTHASRVADMAEAMALSSVCDDPAEACAATWFSAVAAVEEGDGQRAETLAVRATEMALSLGHPVFVWGTRMHASWRATMQGDLEEAERAAAEALEYGSAHHITESDRLYAVQIIGLRMLQARLAETTDMLEMLVAQLPQLPQLRGYLASAYAGGGDISGARRLTTALTADRSPLSVNQMYLAGLIAWTDAVVTVEDRAAAQVLVTELTPCSGLVAFTGNAIVGTAASALSRLSAFLGDQSASSRFQEIDARLWARLAARSLH